MKRDILIKGEKMKNSRDVLASVLKTAQMGQTGVRSVIPYATQEAFKQALRSQRDEYDEIERQAYNVAESRGWELNDLEPIAKAMSKLCARGSLAIHPTDSKIAAMMINGNTKGLIKGLKNINHYKQDDPTIKSLSKRLLECEEANIKQMQGYV